MAIPRAPAADEQRERRSRPLLSDGRNSLERVARIGRALPPRTSSGSRRSRRGPRTRADCPQTLASGHIRPADSCVETRLQ
jgi:hypothetical protein